MVEVEQATAEMNAAYTDWDPGVDVDLNNHARTLGLIRSAFMAGWSAALRDRDEKLAALSARQAGDLKFEIVVGRRAQQTVVLRLPELLRLYECDTADNLQRESKYRRYPVAEPSLTEHAPNPAG